MRRPPLLPIIEHAVGMGAPPARALCLAAALRWRLVTLASPRPDADAVAPALLAFADAVRAGLSHGKLGRTIRRREARPGPRRPGSPLPSAAPATPGTGSVTTYVVGGMPPAPARR